MNTLTFIARVTTLAVPALLLVVLLDYVIGTRLSEHSPTVCDPVDVAAVDDAGDRLLEWILTEAERQAWVNEVHRKLEKRIDERKGTAND
jgi:hypothetical protein